MDKYFYFYLFNLKIIYFSYFRFLKMEYPIQFFDFKINNWTIALNEPNSIQSYYSHGFFF